MYRGDEFRSTFPYLDMGDTPLGCVDPDGGVILADKALRAVQVRDCHKLIKGFVETFFK